MQSKRSHLFWKKRNEEKEKKKSLIFFYVGGSFGKELHRKNVIL